MEPLQEITTPGLHLSQTKEGQPERNSNDVLKQFFGHDEFREGQAESIESVLQQKDTVVLIPTGGGKTVIFSVASLMLPGVTVVVSPLIMLMHDQAVKLREKGIHTCYFNSLMTQEQLQNVYQNISRTDSEYKIVLTSPETLLSTETMMLLKRLSQQKRLNFFAIDEAHCVEMYDPEFRHAYQELGTLKQFGVPVLALTGTATDITIESITSILQLESPVIVRIPSHRPNLCYQIVKKRPGKGCMEQIIAMISEKFQNQSGIIYVNKQDETTQVALDLRMAGISSIYYHGGIIDPEIKVEHARVWLEDEVQVMCCTNAFGMGIDKPDVRFVIHYSMPNSLENLVQEAGRAGRDGDIAQCILMCRFGDRSFHLRNISESNSENIKIKRIASLNTISEYAAQKGCCRQKFIASYFGDQSEEACEICDVCQSTTVPDSVDVGGDVKGLLKCLRSMLLLKDKVTAEELVLTYIGSQSYEVRRHHFENVKEYGHGKGK